ncbi:MULTISPECIES: hypothetical protein [Myxococcus]|uniref:hypothetical protein n=1 Tax=Myxococcus TaxID=32 RepID=UPI0013D2A4F1|nr:MULTISPECIES: hypothetical protein [Myxococcus]NVJ24057.1 hypothetical protein [Myxococcus sp. AM011]
MSTSSLKLSGMGMMTSLGQGAESVCAAIRCGLSRPRPIGDVVVWDADAQDEVPLIGHPVEGVTEGFQGLGRWSRLARLALSDLIRYSALEAWPGEAWKRCGFLFCAPSLAPDRFSFHLAETALLIERLLQAAKLPIPVESRLFFPLGESATWMALKAAGQHLSSGRWDRALLLSVDSLLDTSSLRWLAETRRLKGPEHPVGLMPGEAGVCLLLENPRRCLGRPEATLLAVGMAEAPEEALSKARGTGQALSRAINEALTLTRHAPVGTVIGNLNGEEHRASAWGLALTQTPRSALPSDVREVWPAVNLGDVGAASAAVGMCYAARSMTRRHARPGHTLVWGVSDHGAQGAVLLDSPT